MTCPHDHRSALIGLYTNFFPISGAIQFLRPASIIDLLILILYLQSDIEVNDFQTKSLVHEKVILDMPMGDTKPMEVPEAFDEPLADLVNPARKLARGDAKVIRCCVHLRNNHPQSELRAERVE